MDWTLFVVQCINGLQLGILLFLVAAGLTLIFGIMDFINLAHGSFFMLGAYLCATISDYSGSFFLGIISAVPAVFLIGLAIEILIARRLYKRDHLDHVLATFGIILVLDELVHIIWGPDGYPIMLPQELTILVTIIPGIELPSFRLLIIVVGLIIAFGMFLIVSHTKLGMLIRAGASNRQMVSALGVNIDLLFSVVFAGGAVLAGIAGLMVAPITEANIGMGNEILIVAFVVIIIGGIGSVRGAFIASIIVGLIDTMGRSFLDGLMKLVLSDQTAETAAPAISAMLIYILMAGILYFRPQGLFPPKGR